MFYDLNVKYTNRSGSSNLIEELLSQLSDYGYRGIALTLDVEDADFTSKKEKSKKKNVTEADPVPAALDVTGYRSKFPKLNIYSRINIILSENENVRKVQQSKNIRQYDIISFQPENQNVFRYLTGVGNYDIISYNPETLTSQGSRRNLISLSHIYHAVGKSKNIIVSSGAHLSKHLRGPYDVTNFNLLFGLSEEQAKKAISTNCETLLLKARKQRIGKLMVDVTQVKKDAEEEVLIMEVDDK